MKNTQSSSDMAAPKTGADVVRVSSDVHNVSCDGGGALGHPRVWYSFDGKDEIVCGYCDRLFTKMK